MNADDAEQLVDTLVELGVFEESGDRELRLTDAFGEHRDEYRERAAALDGAEFETTVERYAGDGPVDAADVDRQILGDAMAIYHFTDEIPRQRCLTGALALRTLETTASRDIPDGFVALDGDDIERFIERSPASIVYFWREDCSPCSAVKETLETLLESGEIPDHVSLGAVYGPDAVSLIREQFDVTVAPTLLFCADGTTVSRLEGNKGRESLETEIERLRDGSG